MREYLKFYVNGEWVDPVEERVAEVINPATEVVSGRISLGSQADVDRAVDAARRAFSSWSRSSVAERLDLLMSIQAEYGRRAVELGRAVTEEMGAPVSLELQVEIGTAHLQAAIEVLKNFKFEEQHGITMIVREPIGVCGLITPWNWPVNQMMVKLLPAIATGCTCILKPPQLGPYSAQIISEIVHAAGTPAGVFNMIQGSGSVIGTALSRHEAVDMISFTGSEAIGIQVAKDAADTVKRVSLELGGKSAWIVLDDEDLAPNVAAATSAMMVNSGQTCSAGSRLLVPHGRLSEAVAVARTAAEAVSVGDPLGNAAMGPVVSKKQYDTVQRYIQIGIDEGARLVAGGPGNPDGISRGYFCRPTVFVATNDMRIAREEIFGPVLTLIAYNDVEHAVGIANDSPFGLGGYVSGRDLDIMRAVARRMRTGSIRVNEAFDVFAPFGGYKKSGNGREWGEHGFHEFLETKAVIGWSVNPRH